MKTMRKKLFALVTAGLLALSLAACGGSSSYAVSSSMPISKMESAAMSGNAASDGDYGWTEEYAEEETYYDETETANDGDVSQPQKMIYRASLELETMEFDSAVSALEKLTAELGGYTENSSLGGSGYRWASYTLRVPTEHYHDFLNHVGENCRETWRDTSQEDVSESYYDSEGRLETQKTKLARLQELLGQAEDMEDIITIESAISETEETIDSLSGTLKHYDALVDYATITVTISEVYRFSTDDDATPLTFGERLQNAFVSGVSNFFNSLEDLIIMVTYDWLTLLVLAVLIILVVLLVKKIRKRRAARKAKRAAETADTE